MTLSIINSVKNHLYCLELPAACENLEHIRGFVSGIAGRMGFSEEQISQIELIVDEACCNVIKHAYKNNTSPDNTIQMTIQKFVNKIEIVIADKGPGFDPATIEQPDWKRYQKKMIMGGLGLYLIKSFSDELQFSFQPGVRNEVKMVKFLRKTA